MTIHLLRGVYGCAVLNGLYLGIRDTLLIPVLSDDAKIVKSGEEDHGCRDFVEKVAQELGMKKTIILMRGSRFWSFGCHAFSPKVGMEVNMEKLKSSPLMSQVWIAHHIAHIQSNDILTWSFVPLVLSIFAVVLLNSRFPYGAPSAGLVMMGVSYLVIYKWREAQAYRVAFEHCSKEANEAAEKHFEAKVTANPPLPALSRWRNFFSQLTQPSPETLLLYCRARLKAMK
ncbi:MAG: hypothetical protein JSS10_06810 [Verrucomicrobia bacterium]|nr:hypothetical protein [Verrucomicrobiota bacterium]